MAKEKRSFSVQMDKDLYEEFSAFCEDADIPKATVVSILVRQMLASGGLTVASRTREEYRYAVVNVPKE